MRSSQTVQWAIRAVLCPKCRIYLNNHFTAFSIHLYSFMSWDDFVQIPAAFLNFLCFVRLCHGTMPLAASGAQWRSESASIVLVDSLFPLPGYRRVQARDGTMHSLQIYTYTSIVFKKLWTGRKVPCPVNDWCQWLEKDIGHWTCVA